MERAREPVIKVTAHPAMLALAGVVEAVERLVEGCALEEV